MTYQRTACTYLVIEDRPPTRYEINGNAVISGSYQIKDAAMRAAAGREARVLPIRINLSPDFFVQPVATINVPDDHTHSTGEVTA